VKEALRLLELIVGLLQLQVGVAGALDQEINVLHRGIRRTGAEVEVGTGKYVAEYIQGRSRLLGVFQDGLSVVHGFPIPLSGITDRSCIRELVDTLDWLASVSVSSCRDVVASRSLFRKLLLGSGSPEASDQSGLSVTSN
jgi:hypothetical protein